MLQGQIAAVSSALVRGRHDEVKKFSSSISLYIYLAKDNSQPILGTLIHGYCDNHDSIDPTTLDIRHCPSD